MKIKAYSVSEIIYSIKNLLESEFKSITVVGEVSNLSSSGAGHYYFTLSDENSSLSSAIFKMDAFRNPVIRKLKDGDKVLVQGPISVYGKRGTFQLIAKKIVPYGKGDLKAQFEYLKEKLNKLGLFDLEHKVEIPKLAKKIAIITAPNGAAIQDFLNVMRRRTLWHDITIVPATVQGDGCARSVLNAINKIERKGGFDVIVITRGGGSIEDLWGFNDEALVKKVFELETPVLSAIGHQTDFTLLDYVSDYRAETPTAAAEILSQEQTQLKQKLSLSSRRLRSCIFELKTNVEKRLERINPLNILHIMKEQVFNVKERLNSLQLDKREELLGIGNYYRELDESIQRALQVMNSKLEAEIKRLDLSSKLLHSMNPKEVLGRGYSFVKSGDTLIKSLEDFKKIERETDIEIHFKDGSGKVRK